MLKIVSSLFIIVLSFQTTAQFSLSGTYDAYAAISKKGLSLLPFMVSHAKLGQFDINLLELELRYDYKNWRFQLAPAIGSYMSNNYGAELPYRRYLYESYLQYKWKNSEIAYGTFSSPYTQETPRAVDQISATRSLAAEYVPYYVSGLRWTNNWSKFIKTQVFLTNGWQRLSFTKSRPSFGFLLQYQKDKWNLNWSHFYGDVAPKGKLDTTTAVNRWRFFQEINVAYTQNNWTFQSCAYAGLQKQNGSADLKYWLQGNVQASYALNERFNFSARTEVFFDPNSIVFNYTKQAFSSMGLGFMYRIGPVLQCGQEFRYFFTKETQIPVYYSFLRLKF